MRNARGFTLTELLITMVVMGILGLALARLMINNSDFVSRQDAMMEAREVARSAMNVMSPELRLVSDAGVFAAHKDSIGARVPYAFAVACRRFFSNLVATVMPADSLTYAQATADGIGVQSGNTYIFRTGITVSDAGWPYTLICPLDNINVLPGGRLVIVSGLSSANTPAVGTIFYLYQNIIYRFRTSTELPGRRSLWRKAGGAAYEELVAPFDTSARFAFLMGPNMLVDTRVNFTSQTRRDSIRGLEFWLVGQSQYMPRGTTRYQNFDLRPAVAFLNRIN